MTFQHRESTFIKLGAVEAYAKAKRRTMTVLNTNATLSLFALTPGRTPDCLLALREGDHVTPQRLHPFLPGLPDVQWKFVDAPNETGYRLEAVSDDVVLALSMAKAAEPSSFLAEGRLRGIAARFVVTTRNGSGSAEREHES